MPIKAPKGFIEESDPRVSLIGHPAPPWLVNYADLMTELVCFFVILYALSAALNKDVQKARQDVQEMIDKGQVSGEAKIDKEGLKITLEEQGKNVFFQSGSAEITPEMEGLMGKVAPVLQKLVNQHEIMVEGHTDAVKIKNDLYLSNWELSTARATTVVEHLIRRHAFPPEKMAAVGYGEHRPMVPNDSPENRAKNRRVVFFVKNAPFKAAQAGAGAAAATAGAGQGKKAEAAPAPKAESPKGPGFFKRTWSKFTGMIAKITPKFIRKWFN